MHATMILNISIFIINQNKFEYTEKRASFSNTVYRSMKQKIVGFHQDEDHHWVAQLACGHNQHVRHDPPWQNRPWVITSQGRQDKIGLILECVKCDEGANLDR